MDPVTDPISYARDVVGCDPLATFLGVAIDEVRPGYARCSLVVKPEYLNAAGRAHGAAVAAVADQAFAVASNSLGSRALAVNLKLTYTAAAPAGDVMVAEATPVNVGRKVSVWKIDVRGRENGLIASCEGIAYHK